MGKLACWAALGPKLALHSSVWVGGASLPAVLTPKQGYSPCQTWLGLGLGQESGVGGIRSKFAQQLLCTPETSDVSLSVLLCRIFYRQARL